MKHQFDLAQYAFCSACIVLKFSAQIDYTNNASDGHVLSF
jgi:hypothetical protein